MLTNNSNLVKFYNNKRNVVNKLFEILHVILIIYSL